jgi:hypothetical protein
VIDDNTMVAERFGPPGFAQVKDCLRHPHPFLPLKGEGLKGRGQRHALPVRRSVASALRFVSIRVHLWLNRSSCGRLGTGCYQTMEAK